ncbi:hypothetical protein MAY76_10860 [Edwardsiella ictaluri]|nr:hypothetical protein [Edwardsiella ictaluri]WFO11433.1 hypothetical protein MAY76_10860 [Edwardsiella ictaluri]
MVSQGPLTLSTLGDLNNRQGVIQGDDITLNTRGLHSITRAARCTVYRHWQ